MGRQAHDAETSWYRLYALALVAADMLAVAIGAAVAGALGLTVVVASLSTFSLLPVTQVLLIGAPVWLAVLALTGAYHRRWVGTGSEEYRRVIDAALRFVVLVATTAFVFNVQLARGFLAVALAVAVCSSLLLRYGLRRWLHAGRSDGKYSKSVLVVGSEAAAAEILEHLVMSRHAGFRPVAACVPGDAEALVVEGCTVPVVARPERALQAALIARTDAIVIADATTLSSRDLRRLAWELEGTCIDLMVTPAVTGVTGPRISIRPVADLPLLHVEEPEFNGIRRVVKATIDRLLALFALVLLAPLLILIGIAVRVTSRGPVFFRQVRVGLGGRHFVVWKFRTMIVDAESRLPTIMHLNEHDGLLFKIKDDPRVTRVGRFLRRWSLDELPQLWNVLRGDMSIVGPRPPIPSEVERYDDHVRRRLLVKPGITGLWQISGRAGLPWDEAVRLDLYYVENWSLSMDAMVLVRTLIAVLRGNGAF